MEYHISMDESHTEPGNYVGDAWYKMRGINNTSVYHVDEGSYIFQSGKTYYGYNREEDATNMIDSLQVQEQEIIHPFDQTQRNTQEDNTIQLLLLAGIVLYMYTRKR